MHWADVEAEELDPEPHIATGVAPSGPIHLGGLKELLTGEAIKRSSNGELTLIVDSFDPLRKLYPFLDEGYEKYIGMPLSEIPCPCGDHESYSEHYLQPFLEGLDRLGVDVKVEKAHEMYSEGRYERATEKILNCKEEVKSIIEGKTGRELPKTWYPYNPLCGGCGTFGSTEVIDFEDHYVKYECECGHEGRADIRSDDGKLPWRCDWPARWWILGVKCEPFGKDHAASGGSWDTGKAIIEDVLEDDPPNPVIYEWVHLKGEGPMSSSKGVVVTVEESISMIGPEAVRFLMMKNKPNTQIDFDTGLGILDLMDDFDEHEEIYFEDGDEDKTRIYELSQVEDVPDEKPQRIPYRHLVNLIQIYDDPEKIWEVAQETGQITEDKEKDFERFEKRAEHVKFWLENYAPDMVKFSLKKELPEIEVDEEEKNFLRAYLNELDKVEWKSERLHQLVHECAEEVDIQKGKAFRSFYKILLGDKKGPRLGRFLSQLERDFVKERMNEAV
ncbi:MAG: lysine--tRNA ligase [Candidatus Thermoplasmatota archaeon]|nr:lysine--tRNA ligase [Candidatus Thermoplasmatota archaeon]